MNLPCRSSPRVFTWRPMYCPLCGGHFMAYMTTEQAKAIDAFGPVGNPASHRTHGDVETAGDFNRGSLTERDWCPAINEKKTPVIARLNWSP